MFTSLIPKVRIQRKRKGFLEEAANRNVRQAKALVTLLSLFLRPWIDQERAAKERVVIENRRAATELAVIRQSLVAEQAMRQELLNAKTRLELEARFGKRKVAEMLGERVAQQDDFRPDRY